MGATSKRRVCIFVEAVMSARKRYRPKGVSADSWKIAIQGSCLLSKSDQKVRVNLLSDAVEKIGKGQGSKEIWQSVFDCMNMLEAFSRMPKVMRNANDYKLGVAIYNYFGTSAVLKKCFANGENNFWKAKLISEMKKLAVQHPEIIITPSKKSKIPTAIKSQNSYAALNKKPFIDPNFINPILYFESDNAV